MISAENYQEAEEDLTRKLTEVYGEPIHASRDLWVGTGNTLVYLDCMPSQNMIVYMKALEPDDRVFLLTPAPPAEPMPMPTNHADPSDTGGL